MMHAPVSHPSPASRPLRAARPLPAAGEPPQRELADGEADLLLQQQPAAAAPEPVVASGRRWSDGIGTPLRNDPDAPWSMNQQWPALVATLSEQAVESSNLVLRALDFLVGAGRLRRAEAKTLSDALFQLRETSLRAQQVTRLASGRIRQARDRVDLAEVVRQVLAERGGEFAAAQATVRGELQPVDVLMDPPVAVSLVDNLVDWALTFSRELVLSVRTPTWPEPARLQARIATQARPAAQPATAGPPAGTWGTRPRGRRVNDTLHWMLLRQMAASAGLKVRREAVDGGTLLTIEFPRTFHQADGVATVDLMDDGAAAVALRDGWVLAVVRDPVLRATALDALRRMGIEARGVADAAAARQLASLARPTLLVVAQDALEGPVQAFRQAVLASGETCPLVEITELSPSFHLNGFEGFETAKVGRDDVARELGAAVLFEMAKMG